MSDAAFKRHRKSGKKTWKNVKADEHAESRSSQNSHEFIPSYNNPFLESYYKVTEQYQAANPRSRSRSKSISKIVMSSRISSII